MREEKWIPYIGSIYVIDFICPMHDENDTLWPFSKEMELFVSSMVPNQLSDALCLIFKDIFNQETWKVLEVLFGG